MGEFKDTYGPWTGRHHFPILGPGIHARAPLVPVCRVEGMPSAASVRGQCRRPELIQPYSGLFYVAE